MRSNFWYLVGEMHLRVCLNLTLPQRKVSRESYILSIPTCFHSFFVYSVSDVLSTDLYLWWFQWNPMSGNVWILWPRDGPVDSNRTNEQPAQWLWTNCICRKNICSKYKKIKTQSVLRQKYFFILFKQSCVNLYRLMQTNATFLRVYKPVAGNSSTFCSVSIMMHIWFMWYLCISYMQ